jgi:hypothetical protein
VRQTSCGDGFQIEATDTATGRTGSATGRARFIGQHTKLDVVMLGRGSVRGRVTWDDGAVPSAARVAAYSPVFREGRSVLVDANGNYALTEIPVGTITLSATDGEGRYTVKTIGSRRPERRDEGPRDPRSPASRRAGSCAAPWFPDGQEGRAYVALYSRGFLGYRRTGGDGCFDSARSRSARRNRGVRRGDRDPGADLLQVFPDRVNHQPHPARRPRVVQYVYRQMSRAPSKPLLASWSGRGSRSTVTAGQRLVRPDGVRRTGTHAADLARKLRSRVDHDLGGRADGQAQPLPARSPPAASPARC